MKRLLLAMGLTFSLGLGTAHALEPTTIEILTMPFGTTSYAKDMALESLFKEIKNPITLSLKQTPGAMFISRFVVDNSDKMRTGKMPFIIAPTMDNIVPYMAKGLPPYEKYPTPDFRIISVVNGMLLPFVTFDANIKDLSGFVGKKVGIAELSRPNMSTLPNKPIFDKNYGGFDKVSWQYLGFANSKDAILNGSIDAHMGNVVCAIKVAEDGSLYADSGTPDPSLMEVISAGKDFHVVSTDPETLRNSYDAQKDMAFTPVLMKAGTIAGQKEDAWVMGAFSVYVLDKDVPDEVVEEIVYQMITNRKRLSDYYEGFAYLSETPYAPGIDHKWYHPGMFRAMKRLGLPLPDGVTLP